MLRRLVQLLAAAVALLGAGFMLTGDHSPGVQLLFLGALLLIAVRYESWRDRAKPPARGPEWQSTGERFEDPGTGKTVEVQYNARTGERRYQPEEDS